ncbi:MAG: hypothetical protein GXY06_00260 [Clostridiaceae bacterium]|nr:hypothetical protein [Clostridiaceae bacterium]
MNPAIVIILILYAASASITAYLHGASDSHRKMYAQAKLITGIGYIILAVYCAYLTEFKDIFFLMFPAFWGALAGDYLLGIAHKNKNHKGTIFQAGAVAFMLTHILFYVAFSLRWPFSLLELIIPVVMLMMILIVVSRGNYEFGKIKNLVLPYTFCVSLMPAKAVSQFMTLCFSGSVLPLENITLWIVFAASFLFITSDLILFMMYFSKKERPNLGRWNLLSYYAAMAFFALSLMYL